VQVQVTILGNWMGDWDWDWDWIGTVEDPVPHLRIRSPEFRGGFV